MSETPALEVRALPMAKVHRDPTQPRKIFTPGSIAELADSIRENGLLLSLIHISEPTRPY